MPIMRWGYVTYPQGGCNYSEEISKKNTQIITNLGKKKFYKKHKIGLLRSNVIKFKISIYQEHEECFIE